MDTWFIEHKNVPWSITSGFFNHLINMLLKLLKNYKNLFKNGAHKH